MISKTSRIVIVFTLIILTLVKRLVHRKPFAPLIVLSMCITLPYLAARGIAFPGLPEGGVPYTILPHTSATLLVLGLCSLSLFLLYARIVRWDALLVVGLIAQNLISAPSASTLKSFHRFLVFFWEFCPWYLSLELFIISFLMVSI